MSYSLRETIEFKLRAAELKVTPARVAILSILGQSRAPLSASEIVEQVKKEKIDQATVYRNLNTLTEAGVVKQIDLRHAHAHYEMAGEDHHHLICQRCGTVEDFFGCNAKSIVTNALKQSKQFDQVDDHSIELYGICKRCL